MSNEHVTYVVAGGCGLIVLVAFVALIVRPAWSSYGGVWQRLAATFLSLYILVAFVGLGVGAGVAVAWFWDRI